MALLLDIAQGAGLAGASGVRPFLPPLLAGALARGDIGIDFDTGGFSFLESPWFLLLVLALAVASYAAERRRPKKSTGRDPVTTGFGVAALALGALLFAGSLAGGGATPWPGLLAGAACAALAYLAVSGLFGRVRRRLDAAAAAFLPAYADVAALVLAAVAIFLPPLALLAFVLFVLAIVRGRRREEGKYQGLRILR